MINVIFVLNLEEIDFHVYFSLQLFSSLRWNSVQPVKRGLNSKLDGERRRAINEEKKEQREVFE